MALHGQVKVNGRALFGWVATNQGEVSPGVCRYACRVVVEDGSWVEFDVEHAPTAGAAALASAVLTKAIPATRSPSPFR